MNSKKRFVLSIVYVMLGAVLLTLSMMEVMDPIWSGFGGGLLGCGIMLLVRNIRYRTDEEYKEKMDINYSDERNKYISMKAWSWAGYLFVLLAGIATIVCMILKQTLYMKIASLSVCLMVGLYWICYLVLRRKY